MPGAEPTPPGPPGSIADVISRLREIDASLPPGDGLASFNRVYLQMTESVSAAAGRGGFDDPAFIERLDVVFAQRYFDALASEARCPELVPHAWRSLFEARRREGITPLRFAVAGMNAHINFDLVLAVVAVCEERGSAPVPGGAAHRDYQRIDAVLASTADGVKAWLLPAPLALVDVALDRKDDVAALWSIFRAREAAWTHAESLWELRRVPRLQARFVETLDRFVGFAGRSLLAPQLHLPSHSGQE